MIEGGWPCTRKVRSLFGSGIAVGRQIYRPKYCIGPGSNNGVRPQQPVHYIQPGCISGAYQSRIIGLFLLLSLSAKAFEVIIFGYGWGCLGNLVQNFQKA